MTKEPKAIVPMWYLIHERKKAKKEEKRQKRGKTPKEGKNVKREEKQEKEGEREREITRKTSRFAIFYSIVKGEYLSVTCRLLDNMLNGANVFLKAQYHEENVEAKTILPNADMKNIAHKKPNML